MFYFSADAIMGTSKYYASINTCSKPMSYSNLRICYVVKGSADWEIDGKVYTVTEGDIILLTHWQKRRFQKADSAFELAIISVKHSRLPVRNIFRFYYGLPKETAIFLREKNY